MRFNKAFLAGSLVLVLAQPVFAQAWGQLKSAAQEALSAKRYDEALEFWKKALNACEDKSGPRYIQSLSGIAKCYAAQNHPAEAEEIYKKLFALASDMITDDSIEAMRDYINFLKEQKRDSDASAIATKFSITHDSDGQEKTGSAPLSGSDPRANKESDLKKCQSLLKDGSSQLNQRNFAGSEKLLLEALSLAERYPDNVTVNSEVLGKIIQLYYAQENFAAADPYYLKSMIIMRKVSGAESEQYATALRNHGSLLRKLNRKSEAMAEEAKAERILAKYRASSSSAYGSSGSQTQPYAIDAATRRGSLYQRTGAINEFTKMNNAILNSPE